VSCESAQQIKDIFQVLLLDDRKLPPDLPDAVKSNLESIQHYHPTARHHLLSGEEARGFISGHFGADVVSAYDAIKPFAFKADLARYCLLLVYGGLYSDIGNRFLAPMRAGPGKKMAFFRDLGTGAPWAVANAIIYAHAGREEMQMAITRVVQHCRDRYYGDNALCPTGPVLFGQVLATCNHLPEYQWGEFDHVRTGSPIKNTTFWDHEGRLIAAGIKDEDSNIAHLGITGANSYSAFWNTKRVYGETEFNWPFSDTNIFYTQVTAGDDGIPIMRSNNGVLIYGPYASLNAGRYRAKLKFAAGSLEGRPRIDVCAKQGTLGIADTGTTGVCDEGDCTVSIEFTLTQPYADIEVRVHGNNFEGTYLGLSIASIQ